MAANNAQKRKKSIYAMVFLLLAVFLFLVTYNSSGPESHPIQQSKPTETSRLSADANNQSKHETAKGGKAGRPEHTNPAFGQRVGERRRMVANQIRAEGVTDPNVLRAMETVPRHAFVRAGDLDEAYDDRPLPIGFGQTISQPYIVAYMTEALNLRPDSKVLEIGTGSGYQAAVCAEIASEVYTIEIIEQLAKIAEERLAKLGYRNVFVKTGDGYFGWKETGPYDAIIVTAAAGLVPPPLLEQLKPQGQLILPLGHPFGYQTLVLVTKNNKGEIRSRNLLSVLFVPMRGHIETEKSAPK